VGYTGGSQPDPTYDRLGDHTEAFQIDYDPTRLSYEALLELFWKEHDPTQPPYKRQYMSAVFYEGEAQKKLALATGRQRVAGKSQPLRTQILPLATFYRAEDYHQKYYLRRYADLVRELSAYDERQFEDSTVAARLNAYVSGYGTLESLEAELDRFGLSEAGRTRLRQLTAEVLGRRRH
jgi:peptide-methionine (S)-S-oxide reductase